MAARRQNPTQAPSFSSYLSLVIGLFLVVALAKWGNPIILEVDVPTGTPTDFLELVYGPWPLHWAHWALIPIAILGLAVFVNSRRDVQPLSTFNLPFSIVPLLPAAWLLWQFLSASKTISCELTAVTITHFSVCVAFFYLGLLGLRHRDNSRIIWVCLTMGLFCALRAAFEQHFGGLEATRRMFYQTPNWQDMPPLLLKKIAGNRVFGTLFYPNSLAGAILLLLPIALCFAWLTARRLSRTVGWIVVLAIAGAALAALVWSGSKAGWLLELVIGMVALWHSPVNARWKRWLTCGVLVLGLAGFALKYAGFFQKGATSVAARFDYWKAAMHVTSEHPILGSGPGTFYLEYRKFKSPDAEMTRLCHNDYLQQASDSGLPGAAAFVGLWGMTLVALYRQTRARFDLMAFAVWLGLLGFCMHSFVEFHLYIPALSWTVFFLLGWACSKTRLS